jgi:phosphoribosylformylglycinamidine cyclo-ligase
MYSSGDYDLAGFSVGAAERGKILTGEDVAEGDVVLGLASSGIHANGFSLVRKLVSDNNLSYDDPAPFRPSETLGEALLAPTLIYVKSCLPLVRKGVIKAMAHITGGGFTENIPRVLPEGLGVSIDAGAWPFGDVFAWLAATGPIAVEEIARTFNCGIGMVVVVAADHAAEVSQSLAADGETVWTIGRVVTRQEGEIRVHLSGMEESWQI